MMPARRPNEKPDGSETPPAIIAVLNQMAIPLLIALSGAIFAYGIKRHLQASDDYDSLMTTQMEILSALQRHSNDADRAWAAAFEVTSAISCCRPVASTPSSAVGCLTVTDSGEAKRSAAATKIAAAASSMGSAPAAFSNATH